LVQCVNPFTESIKLPAESMLGRFYSVLADNIKELRKLQENLLGVVADL